MIRSVLNPSIPLGEGDLQRRTLEPELGKSEDHDLLDVLGHCFTDPLFQSLLRFPDGTELSAVQVDEVLGTAVAEVGGQPGGSGVKLLKETGLERKAGLCSVIAGPEICLTTEEKCRLTDLFHKQVDACKDCMPVRWVLA